MGNFWTDMEIVDEIKKPTSTSDPDFTMSRGQNPTSYEFDCGTCNNHLEINFQRQINNSWTGKSEEIDEEDFKSLRTFYKIGLTQKSHDGGQPVFDKVDCSTCGTRYITYCGVREFSNSAYNVQVQGILRIK
jgi:hypothetical protein